MPNALRDLSRDTAESSYGSCMQARARFVFLVSGAAALWCIATAFVSVLTVQEVMSGVTPNTGSLAWPLTVIVLVFVRGAILACLVLVLSGITAAVLNEIGFFVPWSRVRLRVWSILVSCLAALGAIFLGHKFFPAMRTAMDSLIGL